MFKKLNFAVISDTEQELLSAIEEHHKNDNALWKLPNLVIPIATIILALICLLSFSENRFIPINYLNLVINGSLPLIAINQISSIGVHIFKYDRTAENNFGKDTFMLRTKLFWYSITVLVIGVILFAFQVISNPFESWSLLFFMIILSAGLIWFSSYISRRVFLLQDTFVEKTFDNIIREEAKNKLGKKWGNE